MGDYAKQAVEQVLAAGPHGSDNFYRLKVRGEMETHWLNVTAEQLGEIAETLGEGPETPTQKVRALLGTINPNEPGGDWSVYDLSLATSFTYETVTAALDELRPFTGGGRYVGGTSGHLYSIPNEH